MARKYDTPQDIARRAQRDKRIFSRWLAGQTQRRIASEFGVCTQTVSLVVGRGVMAYAKRRYGPNIADRVPYAELRRRVRAAAEGIALAS